MARVNVNTVQLWGDIETTSIEPNSGNLIEIAWMARSHRGEEGSGFKSSLVIPDHFRLSNDPLRDFEDMMSNTDPYVVEMHTKNGLWKDLKELIEKCVNGEDDMKNYAIDSIGLRILEDIKVINPGVDWHSGVVFCGSSPNFDLNWIREKMGRDHPLARIMSHQVLDVSSLLIHDAVIFNRWDEKGNVIYPETEIDDEKPGMSHRALPDILTSYHTWKALVIRNMASHTA